jgi:hypothetical protein
MLGSYVDTFKQIPNFTEIRATVLQLLHAYKWMGEASLTDAPQGCQLAQ